MSDEDAVASLMRAAPREGVVMSGRRGSAAYETAVERAKESDESCEAIDAVRKAAGGKRRALVKAGELCLLGNAANECMIDSLAFRLICAALSGTGVVELDEASRSRVREITSFSQLTADAQWNELVARVPNLQSFRERAREEYVAANDDRRNGSTWAKWVERELRRIIGPWSGQTDTLASSYAALEVAQNRLYADNP